MDSAGLSTLEGADTADRHRGGRMNLASVNFRRTNLIEVLEIHQGGRGC